MNCVKPGRAFLLAGWLLSATVATPALALAAQATASGPTVRVVGVVRDDANALTLPGIPVEVVDTKQVVYTDVDGRYVIDVPRGTHQLRIEMPGYQTRTVNLTVDTERTVTVDVGLTMTRFAENITVTAEAVNVATSSAEAQLIERKQAQVITDNVGAQEMKSNGDSNAATAMSRVTGLSLVDNQFVYVRGLGERYSNTTLAGSVLPTTEPDKKVVPLDLFPTGLIDSVQVAKSYSPDKSAEFAGGLVQIVPLKLPSNPVVDFSYGLNVSSTATGKDILTSPLGNRDWLGYDNGARALPDAFPSGKIVRQGVYTPDVGYLPNQITEFGRLLGNAWQPVESSGKPGQNWSAVFGNRFNRLGVVASVTQSYKEQFVQEDRRFFRVADGTTLEAVSDYAMQTGTQRAQLGVVGNLAYQFNSNNRLSVENFYTHSGRDEGRVFEGPNTEAGFTYRDTRLQYTEEALMSNAVSGEHFVQGLANSRFDWRVNSARANRDEPDLRESLYQKALNGTGTYVLADESQSGFRMFNTLDDKTLDVAANWALSGTPGDRPTQVKLGVNYVNRTRDFASRRFRFVPVVLTKDGPALTDLTQAPELLYAGSNIGTAFRFNEETRPTDAYDGDQKTTALYGMVDLSMTARTRIVAGARVEKFDQQVNTFDPFGLFVRTLSAENKNTDVFPGVNLVQSVGRDSNLRVSYSTTVNRPEFRELAAFEFTDVVGSRAVRGNPDLKRALIHNVDGRWEMFSGGRGVVAASVFYKYFDQPIERVVVGGATPLVTYQNSDHARNAGVELEFGHSIGSNLFVQANYTFVDSKITLLPEQRTVQTSLERPLAGQSKHLFNMSAEQTIGGFSARVLVNYFGDRISDVGANEAPDILEQGRGAVDLVFSQRIGALGIRLNLENLTDSKYLFTQGSEDQRVYALGRAVALSLGFNVF